MTIPRAPRVASFVLGLVLAAAWTVPAPACGGKFHLFGNCRQSRHSAYSAQCVPATYSYQFTPYATPQAYAPPLQRPQPAAPVPAKSTPSPQATPQAPAKVLPWGSATYPYNQSYTPAERAANQVTTDPYTAPAPSGDPYGFVVWLNGERSRRGLAAVVWDETCAHHAYVNNQWQAAKGLNHWHHVCRRQNAGAMGPGLETWIAWAGHGPHADALFDPTITRVGLHVWGHYQTFNAN